MADIKSLRINDQIRVREVRLSDEEGNQLGIFPISEALKKATDLGLDLVEIVPQAKPPVCKHDLDVKAKAVRTFLEGGDKVKVTIRFRGRELAHTELGLDVMQAVLDRLKTEDSEELYIIEKKALMEGRNMSMTLAPKAKK